MTQICPPGGPAAGLPAAGRPALPANATLAVASCPVPRDITAAAIFAAVWRDGRLDENLELVYGADGHPRDVVAGGGTAPLTYTKLDLVRAAGRASRATGRGGGTTTPGRMLLRLAPTALRTLARRLPGGVVLISATNGKTTTARMLVEILRADGRTVIHNRAGANTHWGLATALAEGDGDLAVLEVDEAWLPLVAGQLEPRLVLLGNLFRDRLDGYGELQRLLGLWRAMVNAPGATFAVVTNADDPLLCHVTAGSGARRTLFGIADPDLGRSHPEHPHEAEACPQCGHRLGYRAAFVGHLGLWSCSHCALSRPRPAVRALSAHLRGLARTQVTLDADGDRHQLEIAQPGLGNVYNALAAATAASHLGASSSAIAYGLQAARAPFGRGETIAVGGRSLHLLLVKNPVGANLTLDLIAASAPDSRLHLWLALGDGQADGRDVSWIWDAGYERLAGRVASATCSGPRAAELAVRLKYAGWDGELAVERDLARSLRAALEHADEQLFALPTYTQLLGLRPVLGDLGVDVTDWGMTARRATVAPSEFR
jgi:UDP-N-acetylmuramyl tripeptide synthase